MKSSTQTILLAICALVLSSCSIVRGLTTDGKYGPNIFSFEKREVDTIANGEYTFQFPIGKRAEPNAPTRMNCLIPQRST